MILKALFGTPLVAKKDNTNIAPIRGTFMGDSKEVLDAANRKIRAEGNAAYSTLRFLPYTRWATDALDITGVSPDIDSPDFTDATQGVSHVGRGWAKANYLHYKDLPIGKRIKVGPRKRHPYMTVTLSTKNDGMWIANKIGNGFKYLGLVGFGGDIIQAGRNLKELYNAEQNYQHVLDSVRDARTPRIPYVKKLLEGGTLKTKSSGKFRTRDINGNWVYMDMNTGRTTSASPESGTIRNNAVDNVGGDNKTKRGRTKIALKQMTSYNNKQYKVHNYADTTMRLKLKNQDVVLNEQGEPVVIQANYTPTLEAPMEIVSPEFDLLTLGRQAATSMYKAVKPATKPTVDIMADTAPGMKSTTLSQEQIEQAFNQARQWHLNRINSTGYRDRALRAGFTEEEIPQLLQLLTNLINRLKLLRPEEVLGSNIRLNHNLDGKPSAGYWRTNVNGNLRLGIEFNNPNMSYDDAVSTFVHEFGHGATFGLNGTETEGYMKMIADQFPLINRAVKYNKSLYPELTTEKLNLIFPTGKGVGYYTKPTEIQSRGYEFMRDFTNNKFKLSQLGKLNNNTTMEELTGNRFNSRLFSALTGNLGAYNFYKNALSFGAPVGMMAGYGMSLDELVEFQKKGGKTHRPFGHRSILDNGWQSTKLLKNKKNVYGKSKS